MVASSSASCRRLGKALSANSLNAREKVASLGIARTLFQPHRRRSVQSLASRSMSARVVVMSNTALAMKARATAARSFCGLPRSCKDGSKRSTRTNSTTRTNAW